jgi:uncharacterized membrane protein
MTKPIIIILLFAIAIAFAMAESDNIQLLIATKVIAAGIIYGTCRLYDKWEPELNQPVKED